VPADVAAIHLLLSDRMAASSSSTRGRTISASGTCRDFFTLECLRELSSAYHNTTHGVGIRHQLRLIALGRSSWCIEAPIRKNSGTCPGKSTHTRVRSLEPSFP